MNRLIIIGASGHGKVAADIARLCGYKRISFLDDDERRKDCGGYKVIGTGKTMESFVKNSTDFFVAIGNSENRKNYQKQIEKARGNVISLLHPNAVVAEDVQIGKGTILMAGTVINAGTKIGTGCIINTASSIDHDGQIGDFVHIAVGAHLSGTVKIGSGTWVGAGATVSNNIYICGSCMIGAGAVVVRDVTDAGVYVGVPAKLINKEKNEDEYTNFV